MMIFDEFKTKTEFENYLKDNVNSDVIVHIYNKPSKEFIGNVIKVGLKNRTFSIKKTDNFDYFFAKYSLNNRELYNFKIKEVLIRHINEVT